MTDQFTSGGAAASADQIVARIERLPPSRWSVRARIIVGSATFFDGFDGLALVYTLPALGSATSRAAPPATIMA